MAQATFDALRVNSITVSTLKVSQLPTASSCKGRRYMVSDATATTFWSTVAGSGSNTVPVTSDGTNWKIG